MIQYRNITTATSSILGRVAGCQHHAWGIRNANNNGKRSRYSRPMEFEQWFSRGIAFYESKGFKFQWLNLTTLKVTLPNGKTGTRTYEDFHNEYIEDYCSQYPSY